MILITTKLKLNQVYPIPASASNSELTGSPTAPTPPTSDNSTKIATTEYVRNYNYANYLPLTGGTVDGYIRSTDNIVIRNLDSPSPCFIKNNVDLERGNVSTSINSTSIGIIRYTDVNNKIVGQLYANYNVSNANNYYNEINLASYNPNSTDATYARIGVGYNQNGAYTVAPTPAASDNSTKIATTAYVKSNLSSYLPLAGGTETGTIVFNLASPYYAIRNSTNNNYLTFLGGSSGDASAGSKLLLYGASYTNNPGGFNLQAGNSDGYKQLVGKPDGTLTWGGTSISLSTHTHSYLPLSGGTLTGALSTNSDINLTAGKIMITTNSTEAEHTTEVIRATTGTNDSWRIASGATATNAGFVEISTADDGSEPIYVRQYSGNYVTLKRTATILDGSGNTSFPGTVTAPTFSGSLSGTANYAYNIAGQKISSLTKGTNPSSTVWTSSWIKYDSAGTATANRLGELRSYVNASGQTGYEMLTYDYTSGATSAGTLGIYKPLGGTAYTAAPTPAQTDDSTKIATTAYVKDCVPKSIGSSSIPVYTNANGVVTACGAIGIANGGTGATTRLNAVKNLTNENVGSGANYFLTITTSWGKAGYTSIADAKTALGLGSAAYTASTAYATSGHTHNYLPLSGGTLTGSFYIQSSSMTRGTAPSANHYLTWGCRDSASNYIGAFEAGYYKDKSSKVALYAYNTTAATGGTIGSLGIGCNTSGAVYTWSPTPGATDNSTQIATTAFVRTREAKIEIQQGIIGKISATAGSYQTGSVTFTKAFSGVPRVVCSIHTNSTGTNYSLTCASYSESKTGFNWYMYNPSTTAREPYINWIAIYDAR